MLGLFDITVGVVAVTFVSEGFLPAQRTLIFDGDSSKTIGNRKIKLRWSLEVILRIKTKFRITCPEKT